LQLCSQSSITTIEKKKRKRKKKREENELNEQITKMN